MYYNRSYIGGTSCRVGMAHLNGDEKERGAWTPQE